VIALVVQPGVEFNHDHVVDYDPSRATHLATLLNEVDGLVYEAHSTDYQRPEAYRHLVHDGFAILKVGPALTFAMREALTDLSQVEAELVPHWQTSHLVDVLERVMLDKPSNWQHHYTGDGQTEHLMRRFSYSDRVRYYWHEPRVKEAVNVLMANLGRTSIPETLLSCFLPDEYRALRAGTLQSDAHSLIIHRIRGVLRPYAAACAN
jgi:D-tagatose-1,6-bisphosphate aldolase subunit GatZ/KbaZ